MIPWLFSNCFIIIVCYKLRSTYSGSTCFTLISNLIFWLEIHLLWGSPNGDFTNKSHESAYQLHDGADHWDSGYIAQIATTAVDLAFDWRIRWLAGFMCFAFRFRTATFGEMLGVVFVYFNFYTVIFFPRASHFFGRTVFPTLSAIALIAFVGISFQMEQTNHQSINQSLSRSAIWKKELWIWKRFNLF